MNRIRQLREERNWKQDELGKLLNVKRAAISKYETGKIPLTDETIHRLTEIFDVTSDYLLGISKNSNFVKHEDKSLSSQEATELLTQKFIEHGIINEGEDLSEKQLDDYLKKLSAIVSAFKE